MSEGQDTSNHARAFCLPKLCITCASEDHVDQPHIQASTNSNYPSGDVQLLPPAKPKIFKSPQQGSLKILEEGRPNKFRRETQQKGYKKSCETVSVKNPPSSLLYPDNDKKMGNFFGRRKKKKSVDEDTDDGEVWKLRTDKENASKKNKTKEKKKKKDKNASPAVRKKSEGNASVSSSKDGSIKKIDPKRYALYEPNPNASRKLPDVTNIEPQIRYRSKTLPTRFEASEIRRSIGDPMDFKMADDFSSSSSHAPTPPVRKSPAPVYKKIQFPGKKSPSVSAPNTPRSKRKVYDNKNKPSIPSPPPKIKYVKQSSKDSSSGKSSTSELVPPGATKARSYILPSPPVRPKFRAGFPLEGSPNVLRKYDPHSLAENMTEVHNSEVCKTKVLFDKNNIPQYESSVLHSPPVPQYESSVLNSPPVPIRSCSLRASKAKDVRHHRTDLMDSSHQMEDENEINMRKELNRKLVKLSNGNKTNLEECETISETFIDTVEPQEVRTEQHEIISGPKVAVLSTIPPPEKAVISMVPPPSPTAMDRLCEEEEEDFVDADDEILEDNVYVDPKNKEVEEFSDKVCQRLSQLLENQGDDDDVSNQTLDVERSPIQPGSPRILLQSGGYDIFQRSTDNSDFELTKSPVLRESENKWKEIPDTIHCVEIEQHEPQATIMDRSSIIIKSPHAGSDTSDLDTANNNFVGEDESLSVPKSKRNLYKLERQDAESESYTSSSEYSSSSYSSDSEYSSHEDLLQEGDPDVYYDEGNVYAVPWDLRKSRFSREGCTDNGGVDLSDEFEEKIIYARPRQDGMSPNSQTPDLGEGYQGKRQCDYSGYDSPNISNRGFHYGDLEPYLIDNSWNKYEQDRYSNQDIVYTSEKGPPVEEPTLMPVREPKDYNMPRTLPHESEDEIVLEDVIEPVDAHLHENAFLPKRESEILCDVIDSYTEKDDAVSFHAGRCSPCVPPKGDSYYEGEIDLPTPQNPSRLDKSILRIFKDPLEDDEPYPELAPLQSLIQTAEEGEPLSLVQPTFRLSDLPSVKKFYHGSKRSLSYTTESDLDMSEHMDDDVSEDMDADDEDEDMGGDYGTGDDDIEEEHQPVFSNPLPRNQGEVLVSRKVLNTAAFQSESDNDSVFLEGDCQEQGGGYRRDRDRKWLRHKFDIPPPPSTEFDENIQPLNLMLPLPPPSQPSPPPYPHQTVDPSLNLATTYRAISPTNRVPEVAFDDACKQMHDIHEQLQQLRDQMGHFEDDKRSTSSHSSCRERQSDHGKRNVYTD